MRGKHHAIHTGNPGLNFREHIFILRFEAITHGIRQVQHGGAGLNRRMTALDKVTAVRAPRVFGRKLDVRAMRLGQAHGPRDHLQDFFARLVELVLEVNVGGG